MSGDPVVQPEQKRASFGRNQIISLSIFAVSFISTYALVWVEKVTGEQWLSFVQWFGPISIGIIIGTAATVDVARAIKGVQ